MPCYSPLKGWYKLGGGFTLSAETACRDYPLEVPCGQCIGCRLERSRQWASRMVNEMQMHEKNAFLTLTYDAEHLPINQSLEKEHLQLFLKRLRKSLDKKKIRYYACGEYGTETKRPHYHLIAFGYWPEDSTYYKETQEGGKLYISRRLENIWGMGQCVVAHVNFETCAYTARYITEKITGDSAENYYQGRTPPFNLMSRRPGIGATWYEKYKDETWASGKIIMREHETEPPRYYKEKLKIENPELFNELKSEKMKSAFKHREDTTPERLIIRERVVKKKQKTFHKKTV